MAKSKAKEVAEVAVLASVIQDEVPEITLDTDNVLEFVNNIESGTDEFETVVVKEEEITENAIEEALSDDSDTGISEEDIQEKIDTQNKTSETTSADQAESEETTPEITPEKDTEKEPETVPEQDLRGPCSDCGSVDECACQHYVPTMVRVRRKDTNEIVIIDAGKNHNYKEEYLHASGAPFEV